MIQVLKNILFTVQALRGNFGLAIKLLREIKFHTMESNSRLELIDQIVIERELDQPAPSEINSELQQVAWLIENE